MINKSEIKQNIRVRIAPSPTGYFHIGTARTALFNWLFAKKHNGKFILRIEDTDVGRSTKEFEKDILDQMKWLGLDWDEGPEKGGDFGPYYQSQRLNLYEKYLKELIDKKCAYHCFCSEEELEAKRQEALGRGEVFLYDGKCRNLSIDEVNKRIANKESFVIRFKMPDKKIIFTDLIRGKAEFDGKLIGDQVIAKDFRTPLYNFVVVIDDYLMKISHVIRGEDHFSNTPKQIAIYEALGWTDIPKFAHLPLILNADRSKMSKRFGDVSVKEYRNAGYLPQALINFISFLGWHPEEKLGQGIDEILTSEEIVKQFELDRVQKAGAIFNVEKLNWLNNEHLKKIDLDKLIIMAQPYFESVFGKELIKNQEYLKKVIILNKERIKKLSDLPVISEYFFKLPEYSVELLSWKEMGNDKVKFIIDFLYKLLSSLGEADFSKENLEKVLMPEADKMGRGEVFWPLRVALSGLKNSANPIEILEILGKSESLKRLAIALKKINPDV